MLRLSESTANLAGRFKRLESALSGFPFSNFGSQPGSIFPNWANRGYRANRRETLLIQVAKPRPAVAQGGTLLSASARMASLPPRGNYERSPTERRAFKSVPRCPDAVRRASAAALQTWLFWTTESLASSLSAHKPRSHDTAQTRQGWSQRLGDRPRLH